MVDFKKELVQLLELPSNSSNSDVHAACLVKLVTKKRTRTKKAPKAASTKVVDNG